MASDEFSGDAIKTRFSGNGQRPAAPATRHVLALGGDPANLGRVWACFENLGFDVVVATTLSGALAAWHARRFELIAIGSRIPKSTARALLARVGQIGGARRLRLKDSSQHDLGAATHCCLVFALRNALAT